MSRLLAADRSGHYSWAAPNFPTGRGDPHHAAALRAGGCSFTLLPSFFLAGKPTLQNHCGRGTVDIFTPDPLSPLAAGASSLQRFARLERGPTLIDHEDLQAKSFFELGGEAPRGRRK